jgi:TRAP-type C4-dicarboxylate transport system permease small subunit
MNLAFRAFNNLERYLAIFFTVLMVLLLFMQIVSRYVINYSFTRTEELPLSSSSPYTAPIL